jgi:uncharacterized RDD family membrane protein YckC
MTVTATPAGLLRRLGAAVSDSLVVFALLALSTLIVFVPILNVLGKRVMAPAEVGWFLYSLYLFSMLGLWFAFYGYFWKRSGQTIGMRAWRIRVEANDGGLLDWVASLKRWVAAWLPWLPCLITLGVAQRVDSALLKIVGQVLAVLGVAALLWMYRSPARVAWHDRISASRVILLPER